MNRATLSEVMRELGRRGGKVGGRIGGKRSLETMTAAQRSARAQKAAFAREKNRYTLAVGRLRSEPRLQARLGELSKSDSSAFRATEVLYGGDAIVEAISELTGTKSQEIMLGIRKVIEKLESQKAPRKSLVRRGRES